MESLIGEAIVCQDGEVGRLTYVVDPDTGSIICYLCVGSYS